MNINVNLTHDGKCETIIHGYREENIHKTLYPTKSKLNWHQRILNWFRRVPRYYEINIYPPVDLDNRELDDRITNVVLSVLSQNHTESELQEHDERDEQIIQKNQELVDQLDQQGDIPIAQDPDVHLPFQFKGK